ncbi:hypothetical protein BJ742DRAFT_216280 [Cladochytrium replicatum]|nr:hypothetical protein BJ742DRAFT_216280 [Cladochytrium replicatum]
MQNHLWLSTVCNFVIIRVQYVSGRSSLKHCSSLPRTQYDDATNRCSCKLNYSPQNSLKYTFPESFARLEDLPGQWLAQAEGPFHQGRFGKCPQGVFGEQRTEKRRSAERKHRTTCQGPRTRLVGLQALAAQANFSLRTQVADCKAALTTHGVAGLPNSSLVATETEPANSSVFSIIPGGTLRIHCRKRINFSRSHARSSGCLPARVAFLPG